MQVTRRAMRSVVCACSKAQFTSTFVCSPAVLLRIISLERALSGFTSCPSRFTPTRKLKATCVL
jgi:hypothetical protein